MAPLVLGALLALGWGTLRGIAQDSPAGLADGLKITGVLFEDFDGSLLPRFTMTAGGDVILTFRVEGFHREEGLDQSGLPEYHVKLQYDVELQDPQGVLVSPPETDEIEAYLGLRDDDWTPKIRWSASIPAYAPAGDYQIRLQVRDLLDEQEAKASASFRVVGEQFRAAPTLEVQQVEYAGAEAGPWFRQRYFSLHEPVHIRYRVAGFAVSPEKEIWVEQDWQVLDENQQVIVNQENTLVERQQRFYPPRFLATRFQLRLDDPKPGAYTLRITVRDRIAQQSISLDSTFFFRP
ncbi:MAG: hypothetical protein A3H27_17715 [Acidobacteria bacterium RIFCSPLOWO2_02_FULL_59_13]|nr:MAG: hypothetical protein A3H27_17715 [Acidobacteria bacterium RIFCSPLOWO2_02_FULL_59_13]